MKYNRQYIEFYSTIRMEVTMNKNYKKNPYYTKEDIAKAVKLADDFYNKKYCVCVNFYIETIIKIVSASILRKKPCICIKKCVLENKNCIYRKTAMQYLQGAPLCVYLCSR